LKHLNVKQGALIDVDSSGAEAGTVGARSSVVKMGDYYYMAYEVCSAQKDFGQAQWGTSLARATSPDGPWEKIQGGPIIENPQKGYGYDGPELSLQDGQLYLYYCLPGNGTARREVVGLG
jgi:beta-xylosidase